ncbi:MAG: trimethylamine methyltransferase family protein, partial [Anaerolineae bacterium]|nr:trimethylamine methyltransferase family protein [Anaerolineae bacterium]
MSKLPMSRSTSRILTGEQQEKIAAAAFELLEQVGVRLTEPEARALLHGAGARIN